MSIVYSIPVGAVIAQSLVPNDGYVEKLGVIGIVVGGAYFITRYFMARLDNKDAEIQRMSELHLNTVIVALKDSHDAKVKVAEALTALTAAIRDTSRTH